MDEPGAAERGDQRGERLIAQVARRAVIAGPWRATSGSICAIQALFYVRRCIVGRFPDLEAADGPMYTVHMKRMTATEVRKQWFRLLDEVAEGEVILIERDGARLVLKMAPGDSSIPDYRGLIRVPDADEADVWGWEWDGSPEGLTPRLVKPAL